MVRRVARHGLLLAAVSLVACAGSRDPDAKKGPCARGELAGCGAPCSGTAACAPGLFCGNGVCDAQCTFATSAEDCAHGVSCSPSGLCSVGKPVDGTDGLAADGGDPNVCADVKLDATPKTPNVIIIVDQSSSMTAHFGSSTRWQVLKDSLLADDGLIASLQGVVRFGVVLYTSDDGFLRGQTCPLLTPPTISIALNNLDAIRQVYGPAEPADDTPTGDTIEALLTKMKGTALLDGPDPTIFVLATDGEPDTCAEPDPQRGQNVSVVAVQHAFNLGVRTYLIAVADENELSQQHVQDVANAGVGMQNAPSYRVQNDQGLRDALTSIVSGQLSCAVKLHGKVTTSDPCVGTVTLDGQALGCNDPNGWKLVDESHILIQGSACDALKTGKELKASFPCDAAIVL